MVRLFLRFAADAIGTNCLLQKAMVSFVKELRQAQMILMSVDEPELRPAEGCHKLILLVFRYLSICPKFYEFPGSVKTILIPKNLRCLAVISNGL